MAYAGKTHHVQKLITRSLKLTSFPLLLYLVLHLTPTLLLSSVMMEIVVRDTHQRGKNKKKTLEVVETDTLEQLKARISEVFGIAPSAQSLLCYGRILIGDANTLEALGIKDEAVIIVTQPGMLNLDTYLFMYDKNNQSFKITLKWDLSRQIF